MARGETDLKCITPWASHYFYIFDWGTHNSSNAKNNIKCFKKFKITLVLWCYDVWVIFWVKLVIFLITFLLNFSDGFLNAEKFHPLKNILQQTRLTCSEIWTTPLSAIALNRQDPPTVINSTLWLEDFTTATSNKFQSCL